jgi:hypothetical protein
MKSTNKRSFIKKSLYDFHMLCAFFLGCSFVFGAENGDVELKLGVPTTLYIIPNRQ